MGTVRGTAVRIPAAGVFIDGDLRVPERAAGLVVFAHGSGSSRFSRRNRQVAEVDRVQAVVSRGGRPDLAADALPLVKAPTLLIVGGDDERVIELNREAMQRMTAEVRLQIVPGATHLFEEPGTLEEVCRLAAAWCAQHLRKSERL